jgi:hypothetical protein
LHSPCCGHIVLAALALRKTEEAVMQHLPPFSPRHRLAVLAAAFGLAVLVAPAAHAFTIENQGATNSDGNARYTNPDARFSGPNNGQTVIKDGNTTLQFGQRPSFDERYNPNRMFNPIPRPGEDR